MALAFLTVAGRRIRKKISRDLMARLAAALTIVAIAMATLLFIAKCILPILALAAKLKVHTAAAAVLSTQPFLFLVLNSMIVAILAPSGLFKLEEPPAAPPPSAAASAPPASALPSPLPSPLPSEEAEAAQPPPPESPKPSLAADLTNLPEIQEDILPKLKAKKTKRSTSCSSSSSSRVLKRNHIQHSQKSLAQLHQQQIQSQVQLQMEESGGASACSGLFAIDESNRENIPPAWGANNVASTNSLKDEDFKQFIDSFIARARHQMMFQEQLEIAAERAARQGATMR